MLQEKTCYLVSILITDESDVEFNLIGVDIVAKLIARDSDSVP